MGDVVVSGGGTGIGLAVARRFRAEGARTTVLGRRADVLTEAAEGMGATPVVCDVSDPEAVTGVLDRLPGQVDVLVNCAGGNTDFDESADAGGTDLGTDLGGLVAAWHANLRSNLLSAVVLTAALAGRIAADGRVITIGSIAAHTGAGSYGAAKAAVEAWNVDVAAELGPRGITANVVAPGLTTETEFFRGRLSEQRRTRLVAATATGRAGTPADVAGLVTFLASADAAHVTGQVLHVNGGAHLGR